MLPIDSRYLYIAVNEWYRAMEIPSQLCKLTADLLDERITPPLDAELYKSSPMLQMVQRGTAARFRLLQHLTQSYEKPAFGIQSIQRDEKRHVIEEEISFETAFCKLLHFKKSPAVALPRLLLIAPMAGHYATLLRDTVRDALPYFDVYVTDWVNARDVPISQGAFDMDSYIATLVRCFEFLGPDFHVMAICQSGVPALAAVALLEDQPQLQSWLPTTLTIMGSPIDVRRAPTSVNKYAKQYDEGWFEHNALAIVPDGYPGERRLVYPGFLQLAAFISMNPERHQKSLADSVRHYTQGNFEGEEKISSFYAEYCSVMDLTAEFYLQTLRVVFQEALLPQGKLVSRGKLADPKAIRHTSIFAVEGEHDDICGLGQTKAALTITKNLAESKKSYLMLEGAGHYGLFNGHRFRETVLPALRQFIGRQSMRKAKAA